MKTDELNRKLIKNLILQKNGRLTKKNSKLFDQ